MSDSAIFHLKKFAIAVIRESRKTPQAEKAIVLVHSLSDSPYRYKHIDMDGAQKLARLMKETDTIKMMQLFFYETIRRVTLSFTDPTHNRFGFHSCQTYPFTRLVD
jgi:hypothetical protein